jgi:hypothetical protein
VVASLGHSGALGPVSAQEQPTYTLDLRIGRVDGTGPDVFGNIDAIEVDAQGRIYVLDEVNVHVAVFDPAGRPIRTIGRKGGGPGEFDDPVGLSWFRSDQLLVVDENSYVIFDTAGVYLKEFRRPSTTRSYWAGDAYNGVICDYTSGGFIRVDETARVTSTLSMPRPEVPRTRSRAQIPFAPYNLFQYEADCRAGGVWNVDPGAAAIYLISFAGDTIRKIPHGLEQQRIPADVRRRGIDFSARMFSTVSVDEIERATPNVYPYFSTGFVGNTGDVWLSLPRRENTAQPSGMTHYAVISSNGARRTELMPGGVHIVRPVVVGEYFYTVISDALGVHYLLRYRRRAG